jgi:hypothetical protein
MEEGSERRHHWKQTWCARASAHKNEVRLPRKKINQSSKQGKQCSMRGGPCDGVSKGCVAHPRRAQSAGRTAPNARFPTPAHRDHDIAKRPGFSFTSSLKTWNLCCAKLQTLPQRLVDAFGWVRVADCIPRGDCQWRAEQTLVVAKSTCLRRDLRLLCDRMEASSHCHPPTHGGLCSVARRSYTLTAVC